MKKRVVFITSIFLLASLFIGGKDVLAGPRLYFDPASGSYDNGQEFTVTLKIDTNSQEAKAADGIINFDSSRLEVKTVVEAGEPFFPDMTYVLAADDGRLSIFNFEIDPYKSSSGSGDLATITFKTIAEGSASVSLLCQSGDSTDSSIVSLSGSDDIIDCASNGSGSYVIGGGIGGLEGTNSPTPTLATSSATATPTPSELPQTGVETPLLILALAGGIVLLLGSLFAL